MKAILSIAGAILFCVLFSSICLCQSSAKPQVLSTETPVSPSKAGPASPNRQGSVGNLAPERKNTDRDAVPRGAELLGILPGKTSYADLLANETWKTPGAKEVVDGFLVLTYRIKDLPEMPFIQVFLQKDIVQGLVIHMKEPRELNDAKKAFDSTTRNIRTITVKDSEGYYRVIFPEKGLAFVLEKKPDSDSPSERVIRIVVETVNPDYYIIRAERGIHQSLTNSRADAEHALMHDKDKAAAFWILARVEFECGDYEKAREYALKAVKLDRDTIPYQLTLIHTLLNSGQTAQADKLLKISSSHVKDNPLYESDILILQGLLAREGIPANYDRAIELHQRAIDRIKPLLTDEDKILRLEATRMAVKAHLQLAIDIAQKEWSDPKDQELAFQWLNAAGAIADDLIKKEDSDVIPLWEVCLAAIEVGLNMPDSELVDEYIKTMKRLSELLISLKSRTSELQPQGDLDCVARVEYFSGKAFYNAILIYKARKDYEKAIECGEKSLRLLEKSLAKRSDIDRVAIGSVMFQMGLIAEESEKDHKAALEWYNKATVFFTKAETKLTPRQSAKIGKLFVNMSLTCWKSGEKEEALSMTQKGTALIEKALKGGVGKKEDLFVPYSNLATMHKGLGHASDAEKFADLAAKCK